MEERYKAANYVQDNSASVIHQIVRKKEELKKAAVADRKPEINIHILSFLPVRRRMPAKALPFNSLGSH